MSDDIYAGRISRLRINVMLARARAHELVPAAVAGSLWALGKYAALADEADDAYLKLRAMQKVADGSAFHDG